MFLSVTTFVDLAIAASTVYLVRLVFSSDTSNLAPDHETQTWQLLRKADQQRLTASNFIVTKIVTLIVETNILTCEFSLPAQIWLLSAEVAIFSASFAVTALAVFLSFPVRWVTPPLQLTKRLADALSRTETTSFARKLENILLSVSTIAHCRIIRPLGCTL